MILRDWAARVVFAAQDSHEGWEKVKVVITVGFRFFEDNPAYVRLMRREALDGGAHLGGRSTWRPRCARSSTRRWASSSGRWLRARSGATIPARSC